MTSTLFSTPEHLENAVAMVETLLAYYKQLMPAADAVQRENMLQDWKRHLRDWCGVRSTATPEDIQRARDEYGSNELEIDDDAVTSEADDGTWVSAWVWLDNEDEDAEDTDEELESIAEIASSQATLRDAAPELLNALEAVLESLSNWMEIQDEEDARDYDAEAVRIAKAAIDKAKGIRRGPTT